MYRVIKITSPPELEKAFAIRKKVFVEEQQVPPEEEIDQFEDESTHFMAIDDEGNACGTARWRQTDKGIKLERFAVLKNYRGKGVGALLVQQLLADLAEHGLQHKLVYMHAQETALNFYKKFGFMPKGDLFYECDIAHYTMIKQ